MAEPLHRGQKLDWSNIKLNLIGEKVTDSPIHFCHFCDLPVIIYGRMIPCKHAFCHDCAIKSEGKCLRCKDIVQRIERCEQGQVFLCTFGGPKHSNKVCGRTYLSQRDLTAHVEHRHKRGQQIITGTTPKKRTEEHQEMTESGQNQNKRTNLITIPLK